jgi:hypothetical protein
MKKKTKTIRAISNDACIAHLLRRRSFTDVFSDWLLIEKGIEIDDETYEKICDLHWDWFNGKGMFYRAGRYNNVGKHQLAETILKELKIDVDQHEKRQYYTKKTICPKCKHVEKKKIYTSLKVRCLTCKRHATVFDFISSGKVEKGYCEKCAFNKHTYGDEFLFAVTFWDQRKRKPSKLEKARLNNHFIVYIPGGINILDLKTIGKYFRDNFFVKDWNKKPFKY